MGSWIHTFVKVTFTVITFFRKKGTTTKTNYPRLTFYLHLTFFTRMYAEITNILNNYSPKAKLILTNIDFVLGIIQQY